MGVNVTFNEVNAVVLTVVEAVVVVGMMVTLMYFGRAPHTLEYGQADGVKEGCVNGGGNEKCVIYVERRRTSVVLRVDRVLRVGRI